MVHLGLHEHEQDFWWFLVGVYQGGPNRPPLVLSACSSVANLLVAREDRGGEC